jgi:hypothetical protein
MILAFILALASPPVEEAPVSPCAFAIDDPKGSNTLELGAASRACEEEGRAEDAAFLNVLVQIRASADFILLPPQDVLELAEREEFRAVFADRGEFVDEELARNPERFTTLLDRVRKADLSIPAEYDPGWAVADNDKRALYAEVIDGLRTDKLAMESYVAKLVRDETYFAAYLERVAILANLPENGAQLPERFGEVTKIMRERVDVLGEPPTETAVPWKKVYKPGPNAPFTVLHRGFNGPVQGEKLLFRSSAEVRQSWVRNALSEEELSEVLSRIDFDTEVLGVYAVGEMPNASENLFVTEFGPQEDFDRHSIAVRVGVVGERCGFEPSRSYPFVLVKASSKTKGGMNATSRANYPDQCEPVMAGKPTLADDPD